MSRRAAPTIDERADDLREACELLTGIAPAETITAAREALARIEDRRGLSAEHTVIGFFGATGSGKSSLVNAVVGTEISRAAVRRPTTSRPVAAVVGAAGSEALLDWLEVEDRHLLDGSGVALEQAAEEPAPGRRRRRGSEQTPGVILLDLPDLDSIEAANREVAERLVGLVDVLVWVTDPQKYADAVLHRDFVTRYARHDAVSIVVLNQIDRIREAERGPVVESLTAITRADGLASAPVLATSATTGAGLAELRETLLDIARRREAAASRQRADLADAAARLEAAADPSGMAAAATPAQVQELVEALAVAARVEPVARAVGGSYRHRAAVRVGWPPLRWMRRFRPDPLRRLGIGQQGADSALERTSLPEPDAAAAARASGGVRSFADAASAGGSDPWRAAVRRSSRSREHELPDALDQAVAGADLRGRATSWWWPLLDVLQWLALLTWVAGLGWLAVNAALVFLGIPPLPLPMLEGLWIPIPLPTAMIVLGIAAGILIAIAGAVAAAFAAAWHRRRARRILLARVRALADDLVVAEVDAQLERARRVASDLAHAGGSPRGSTV